MHGEAKLVDEDGNEGRVGLVLLCVSGVWSIACRRNGRNPHAAYVVCRQLGYLEQGLDQSN